MAKSKEDYYNTPGSELGGNDDVIVEGEEQETPKGAAGTETPPPSEGELSAEELEKLKGAQAPGAKEVTPSAADKPKEGQEAEEYEIEVDDKSPLTDEDINEVVKMAEEKGMTKAQAQEEIARRESLLNRGVAASEYKANKQLEAYEKEVQAHPLFATNEIKTESMRAVNVALDRFFAPSFKERFELFYKRDIHLLTALHRLGKPFTSDSMEGAPVGAVSKETMSEDAAEEARLKRLYPDQF